MGKACQIKYLDVILFCRNPLTDCNSPDIGNIDLSPWKDPTCPEVCETSFIDYDILMK